MSVPISPFRPVSIPELTRADSPAATPGATPGAFQSVLENMVTGVEQSHAQAQQAANNFLNGGNEELHSVALAAQRSSLEFDLFLQVRNKVVSAYQEVMRMQL